MENINTLRGIACLMLVMFHVVGSTPSHSMQIESGVYRAIADSLALIRMPLFAFIAGYVYAYRPCFDFFTFIKGKARRLLLPMLIFGTVFAVVKHVLIEPVDLAWMHVYPVAHYWFLASIFTLLAFAALLDRAKLINDPWVLSLLFLACSAIFAIDIDAMPFALNKTAEIAPFFVLGLILKRFGQRAYFQIASCLILMLCVAVINGYSAAASIITSSCACFVLLKTIPKIGILDKIGSMSYDIYLMHVFFTAPAVLLVSNPHAAFLAATLSGLLLPIIVSYIKKPSLIDTAYKLSSGGKI